jgi:LysR family transcriptional regulator, regulator of abg operon
MKLHHLRDLLAVVEKGSIRAAAKHLGLGQPALSRSLRDLEQELGVPLLERRARGAVLTEMGEMFARRAGAAFNELSRAREEIAQHQGEVQGRIVVCLSSLSHIALLPSALPPFRKRYLKVELGIIEGTYPMVERRLVDGTIDFFVGPLRNSAIAPGLQQEKLFDNHRVVIARKGHPLQHATSLAELIESDWITTSITNDPEAELNDLFLGHGLPPPRLGLRAESFLTMLVSMISTDMLAIAPRQYATSSLLADFVRQVPVKERLAGPSLFLIKRAAIPLTPAAEYLADLLRRAAIQQPRTT